MSKTAITLIELIMVIVIIGIMAVLAIPRFETYQEIKLEAAARKLVSDIRYTQGLAIAKHENYAVEFNTALEKYRIFRLKDNSTVIDPLTRRNFIVDYKARTEYKGINIVSANFGETSTLRFNYLGVPQDGNGNNLTRNGEVVISYKGQTKTIVITRNTGKVGL